LLPLVNRLKNRSDFREVLSEGQYLKGRLLNIKFVLGSDKNLPALVGFAVSKKFSKRATDRNLIKRRLRHIVREFLGQILAGSKIIILVSRPQTDVSFRDLRDDLKDLLIKAKLYGD
jgi:ribonuclease P protein component